MSEERAEYKVIGGVDIQLRAETLLPYDDPNFEQPNTVDVREALRRGGLTGATAGVLLGVTSRTIRRWTGGDKDISYAAWRLLLMYINEVEPVRLQPESVAAQNQN